MLNIMVYQISMLLKMGTLEICLFLPYLGVFNRNGNLYYFYIVNGSIYAFMKEFVTF